MRYTFQFKENELWWGGSSNYGTAMPICTGAEYSKDFRKFSPNQTMPLYISNQGRYIWSEKPFKAEVIENEFVFDGEDIQIYDGGSTLKDAYLSAMKKHFPFTGKIPPEEFFTAAQFNSWIEFTFTPDQEGIIKYAESIVENGFKPGILMIDEGWQITYGNWDFDPLRFHDPKSMIDRLHQLGFKVMLWVLPFIRPDGEFFIKNVLKTKNKVFMRTESGDAAIIKWWNGFSGILNLADPNDREFFDSQLKRLMDTYGIDGFKFDGGNMHHYAPHNIQNGKLDCKLSPDELNIAYNDFGTRYKYHEFKDTFKGGGKPVIQRLFDKHPTWDGAGINTLIPDTLAQGLMGYPFVCPDMIYGGDWERFANGEPVDEELFVRSAQCAALMPMMQFSMSPWKVLSKDHMEAVKKAADLHCRLSDEIMELVNESATTGEPIVRHMEYEYPHCGYAHINDQFLLGKNILVAPVVTKGTTERKVVFPDGNWIDENENVFSSGIHTVSAPIDTIPWFRKI